MAWTTPLTAIAGAALTASQWNATVRDNLLETGPGKASAAGQHFVATGVNAMAARTSTQAQVATQETTTSLSYVDLTTPGPDLTNVATGTKALVMVAAALSNSLANDYAFMSYGVSNASTISGDDAKSLEVRSAANNAEIRASSVHLETGLTGGNNNWRAKYRAGVAGVAAFSQRTVAVIPFS